FKRRSAVVDFREVNEEIHAQAAVGRRVAGLALVCAILFGLATLVGFAAEAYAAPAAEAWHSSPPIGSPSARASAPTPHERPQSAFAVIRGLRAKERTRGGVGGGPRIRAMGASRTMLALFLVALGA